VTIADIVSSLSHFVDHLVQLHDSVAAGGGVRQRRTRFHFHIYELLRRPHQKRKPTDAGFDSKSGELEEGAQELSIKEALAILENREYTPVREQLWEKVNKCKDALQSDSSVFAAKAAAAATVFAILSGSILKFRRHWLTGTPSVFAETTRQWFINYGLTSGLLTVVVALAPTLGMWYESVMQIRN
jgi:hypothetical protein